MEQPRQVQRVGRGCGAQGCLYGAVALFVILLVGTLVIAVFRFSEPPAGPGMPMSSVERAGGENA